MVLFITQRIFVCCGFWLFLFPPFPWKHRSFGWDPRNKAATTTYTLKREEYFCYCYNYFSSFAFSFLSHAIRIRFSRCILRVIFFCLSRCTFHFFWIIIVLIQTVRMGTMQEMRKKECSERSMWRERIGSTANNQAQCSIRKKESTTWNGKLIQ